MPWNMLPRFVTGIKWVDEAIDEIASAIERGNRWRVQAPLVMVADDNGMTLSLRSDRHRMVKLNTSNGDGSYQASEVRPDPTTAGNWVAAVNPWSGKVWEFNKNSSINLTNTQYVRVEYQPATNDWRFQAGSC